MENTTIQWQLNLKLCKKQRAVKRRQQNTISHLPNNHSVSTSQLSLTVSHHTMSLINAHYTNKAISKAILSRPLSMYSITSF